MVRYLDGVESTRALRLAARTRRTVPAHYVATGKALLAALPWNQVERMLAGVRLEAMPDQSVTDLGVLVPQLQRVRRLGYAAFRGESEEGAASIATTLRDSAMDAERG